MKIKKARNAPPKASSMIEALRGLGYTTATAIADLIDNSISAEAERVEIEFHWGGLESWVRITDDGRGMTDTELDRAMRIGDRNPLHARDAKDLGRFGLGLKTASFSQCRRLTVASRREGEYACLRWDLDSLAADEAGDWNLLEGPHPGSAPRCAIPEMAQGTVVLWELLDRIVTPAFTENALLDLIDQVEGHLAMVFHRYLETNRRALAIHLNGRKVKPWNPFFPSHQSTWRSPKVDIGVGPLRASLQSFVLPHKDRLSEKEYQAAAGPDGWASQQGFYIYRERRMVVAGSWLGLGRGRNWTKDESHRLARIQLDIPNSCDADWKIDIRKSSAQPPVAMRDQLTKMAEDARSRARRVFLHRAQSNSTSGRKDDIAPVWTSQELSTGRRYRIDRRHPAVAALLEEQDDIARPVESLLRILEETIPVQRIWLEAAETGEHAKGGFTAESVDATREVIAVLFRNLVSRKGMSPKDAKAKLLKTEPFDLHPDLIAGLPEVIPQG